MESIIKVVSGSELTKRKCHFCDNQATQVFSIIEMKPQWNGHHLDGFPICYAHLEALNHILDGQCDINDLVKTYDDIIVNENINLRV